MNTSKSVPTLTLLVGCEQLGNDNPIFTLADSKSDRYLAPSLIPVHDCKSCSIDVSNKDWASDFSAVNVPFVDRSGHVRTDAAIPAKIIADTVKRDTDLSAVFVPHMVFSCIAMWCCGCVLGCLGFLFAVISARFEDRGKSVEAKIFSRISFALSLLGIISGIVVIIVLILTSFEII